MVTLKDFNRHKNLPQQYDSSRGNKGNVQQQPGSNQPPGPKGANLPSCSQNPGMWYCYNFGETYGQSYHGFREWGNDNDTPFHTPLYMPYGGTVTDASYQPWGGQVGVSANVPGHGQLIEYIQHLDLIDPTIIPGLPIQAGQYVGISGGQNSGGYHPESTLYSSGPHTEFGFGAPWVKGAQGCQPGASCNPNSVFMFDSARAGNLNGTVSGGPGGGIGFPSIDPCTWPIFGWFCPGSTVNWTDILIRVLLVVSGAIMVYIGANHLFESAGMIPDTYSTEDAVSQATKGSGNSSDKDDEEEDEGEEEEKPQPKEATAKSTAQHKAEAATQQQTQAQATERGPAPATVRGPATA